MRIDRKEIYTSRYIRVGNSFAVTLPPDLRERMHMKLGDVMAMNFEHGVLWMVRLTPEHVISRDTISKIFDKLFPDREDADAR